MTSTLLTSSPYQNNGTPIERVRISQSAKDQLIKLKRLTKIDLVDTECLVGLTEAELQALASGVLAPAAQARLDELLLRQADQQLSPDEGLELDRLLDQVDHLTILKTRARYTLNHMKGSFSAA